MLLLIISMITAVIRVIATLVAFILAEYAVLQNRVTRWDKK